MLSVRCQIWIKNKNATLNDMVSESQTFFQNHIHKPEFATSEYCFNSEFIKKSQHCIDKVSFTASLKNSLQVPERDNRLREKSHWNIQFYRHLLRQSFSRFTINKRIKGIQRDLYIEFKDQRYSSLCPFFLLEYSMIHSHVNYKPIFFF